MKTSWSKAAQKRHRKALIEALRTGGYRQTRHRLCSIKDSMCCLGVACDISGQGFWNWDAVDAEWYFVDKRGEQSPSSMTRLVQEYYGFQSVNGRYGGFTSSLAGDNDQGKKRFKTIAKIIESEPEGMFYD